MSLLLALQLAVLTRLATARTALRARLDAAREQGSDAGLSTLEVTVIAVGLFVVAGVLVAAISDAVQSRLADLG